MLVWTITAFSALLAWLAWRRIVVPFDRMNQLSQDLNDDGFLTRPDDDSKESLPSVRNQIPSHAPAVSASSFV